jgi:hypothetical protein
MRLCRAGSSRRWETFSRLAKGYPSVFARVKAGPQAR